MNEEFKLINIVETKNKKKDAHGNMLFGTVFVHKFESEGSDTKLTIRRNRELPLSIGAVINIDYFDTQTKFQSVTRQAAKLPLEAKSLLLKTAAKVVDKQIRREKKEKKK